jgi:hypothetical protein
MCGQAGLDLPTLGDAARDGINGILKGFGWAANPADVTGFANSESFPGIMEHMVDDPRMGTLVVASAGADAQAQQVISQRDRTDKGVVFLWTGSRDAKAGLGLLRDARIPIFYTRTRWPEACGADWRIIPGASAGWPMGLPRRRRARLGRMRLSLRRLAWGVRCCRSPRASGCWRPGAWGVRVSAWRGL